MLRLPLPFPCPPPTPDSLFRYPQFHVWVGVVWGWTMGYRVGIGRYTVALPKYMNVFVDAETSFGEATSFGIPAVS